jgi:hypothetical protein
MNLPTATMTSIEGYGANSPEDLEASRAASQKESLVNDLASLATQYEPPDVATSGRDSATTIAGIPFKMPNNASTAEWAGMTQEQQAASNATTKVNEAHNQAIAAKLNLPV